MTKNGVKKKVKKKAMDLQKKSLQAEKPPPHPHPFLMVRPKLL